VRTTRMPDLLEVPLQLQKVLFCAAAIIDWFCVIFLQAF